jgi:hypothetical protein
VSDCRRNILKQDKKESFYGETSWDADAAERGESHTERVKKTDQIKEEFLIWKSKF